MSKPITEGQHREQNPLVAQITEMLKTRAPFDDTIDGAQYERAISDQIQSEVLPPIMRGPRQYTLPADRLHHS